MLTNFGAGPGMQTKLETDDVSIWFGHENLVRRAATTKIKSSSVDAVSTPTTTLRQGLILAFSSDGLWCPCDPTAGDITAIPRGVLMEATSMLNVNSGSAEVKHAMGIMIGGPVKAASCKLTSGAMSRAVRDQLRVQGFLFDDEVVPGTTPVAPAYARFAGVVRKGGNYTVVASDSGVLFVATAAATFTLPTIAAGLSFDFVQTADANLAVDGVGLLHKGSLTATSATCSTNGEKIGSHLRVTAIYTGASTLKWMVENLGGTTVTVA